MLILQSCRVHHGTEEGLDSHDGSLAILSREQRYRSNVREQSWHFDSIVESASVLEQRELEGMCYGEHHSTEGMLERDNV